MNQDCHFLTNRLIKSFPSSKITNRSQEKCAIVSGQSIVGMMAAATLAKSGYEVHCYEIREDYKRNIQWAARQSLVDELASVDENLAACFLNRVAKPIYRGSIHIHTGGFHRQKNHEGLEKGDPLRVPLDGAEMMASPSVAIVEAKEFEIFLKEYLKSLPNVQFHRGSFELKKLKFGYTVDGLPHPDLIVIAEGYNSRTRNALGLELAPVAKSKLQIAGVVEVDSGGVMIKHWRKEGDELRLTGVMGQAGIDRTWIVADIDPRVALTQKKIDEEFKRLAAAALDIPNQQIDDLKIYGTTKDVPVTPFLLKQAISKIAFKGENIIFMGDAIGAGHWSVGGGMQIGAVCHIERLKGLLSDLQCGVKKKDALKKYSDGVLKDTQTWINLGFQEKPAI